MVKSGFGGLISLHGALSFASIHFSTGMACGYCWRVFWICTKVPSAGMAGLLYRADTVAGLDKFEQEGKDGMGYFIAVCRQKKENLNICTHSSVEHAGVPQQVCEQAAEERAQTHTVACVSTAGRVQKHQNEDGS